MRTIIKKRDLAKNHEDGRFGILFPDHLVDSRPVLEAKGNSSAVNQGDA